MILIRADANEHIGTGHVMRCLSIAHAFAKRGGKVAFVTADHSGDTLIAQHGLESENLDRAVAEYKPDLLLLDSYYVTERYVNSLKDIVKIAYIDDLNKQCWNVDFLINYNIFADVFDYSEYKNTATKLLLNPQYAPLRDEFRDCSKHEIKMVSDILVSAGGADPESIIEKLIQDVCPIYPGLAFHFILGALNPRLKEIKTLAEERNNAVLHINEKHMSDLMKYCDIAISAAGTTLYELCATGIPTITYILADNQLVAAEQFDSQQIMLSAGDCRGDGGFTERVELLLKQLIGDKRLRTELSIRMQKLVDGNGSDRLVDALL